MAVFYADGSILRGQTASFAVCLAVQGDVF